MPLIARINNTNRQKSLKNLKSFMASTETQQVSHAGEKSLSQNKSNKELENNTFNFKLCNLS